MPRGSRLQLRIDRPGASVALILVLAFVARWVLSGRNSYWLDELLSVATYGIDNASLGTAVRRLADNSIHPPLYQIILYGWMKLFGNTEPDTRFLSNLYVAGAGLCTYLAVRKAAGHRRALMALLFVSLMFVPFYFALETRSYGQSMFLSSLSSLALVRFLGVIEARVGFKALVLDRWTITLILANVGMLMTHYFNAFFLGAQGIFTLLWVGWRAFPIERSVRSTLAAVAKVAVVLVLPLVIQLALWGPVMMQSYARQSGSKHYQASEVETPFASFWANAGKPNFADIHWVVLGALVLALGVLYAAQARSAARGERAARVGRATLACYAFAAAFGSFIVACALFSLAGHERFVARYFSYTAPPLAILLVLALEQVIVLVDRLVARGRLLRVYIKHSAVFALVALLLVLPGTYRAATKDKSDWRGIAQMIDEVIHADPKHKYVLYATGFTTYPSLNYYFARLGSSAKVRGVVRFRADKTSKKYFDGERKKIEKNDFLILSFTHLTTAQMPVALRALSARYEIHQQLIHDGRGIIIYRIKPRVPQAQDG